MDLAALDVKFLVNLLVGHNLTSAEHPRVLKLLLRLLAGKKGAVLENAALFVNFQVFIDHAALEHVAIFDDLIHPQSGGFGRIVPNVVDRLNTRIVTLEVAQQPQRQHKRRRRDHQ